MANQIDSKHFSGGPLESAFDKVAEFFAGLGARVAPKSERRVELSDAYLAMRGLRRDQLLKDARLRYTLEA